MPASHPTDEHPPIAAFRLRPRVRAQLPRSVPTNSQQAPSHRPSLKGSPLPRALDRAISRRRGTHRQLCQSAHYFGHRPERRQVFPALARQRNRSPRAFHSDRPAHQLGDRARRVAHAGVIDRRIRWTQRDRTAGHIDPAHFRSAGHARALRCCQRKSRHVDKMRHTTGSRTL